VESKVVIVALNAAAQWRATATQPYFIVSLLNMKSIDIRSLTPIRFFVILRKKKILSCILPETAYNDASLGVASRVARGTVSLQQRLRYNAPLGCGR